MEQVKGPYTIDSENVIIASDGKPVMARERPWAEKQATIKLFAASYNLLEIVEEVAERYRGRGTLTDSELRALVYSVLHNMEEV